MKWILIGVAAMIALFFAWDSLEALWSRVTLPSKYAAAPRLGVEPVNSEHYELSRIAPCRGRTCAGNVFVLADADTILVERAADQRDDVNYLKLGGNGEVIDEYQPRELAPMNASGVFFGASDYVDWVLSGEAAPKPYVEVLDGDGMAQADFDAALREAQWVDCEADYASKSGRCYLQRADEQGGGWRVLTTKRRFSELEQRDLGGYFDHVLRGYEGLHRQRVQQVPPERRQLGQPPGEVLLPRHLVKHIRFRPKPGSPTGGRNGWRGTGYFTLMHDGEALDFQTPAFRSTGFDMHPELEVYRVPARPSRPAVTVLMGEGGRFPDGIGGNLGVLAVQRR